MAVSISLILTAFGIVAHSANHFMHMEADRIPTNLALGAAFASLVIKEALFRRTMAIAKYVPNPITRQAQHTTIQHTCITAHMHYSTHALQHTN